MLRTLLASAILLASGGAALGYGTDGFQAFTGEAARRIEVGRHPPTVPIVELETQTGTRISLGDLRGRWLLVDFIYTRCPGYCSILGGTFARLEDALATPLAQGRVMLVSISFDPGHDGPPALAGYLRRFGNHGSSWIAARPVDARGLRELERTFGVTVIPDGNGGYVHNEAVEVVNPEGRLVQILESEDPVALARTLPREIR